MAGLGEYGDEGFSSYHAKKNPLLVAQSLSANPIEMGSPAKFLPFLAAIGAKLAATGVGKAVIGAATKLASTKVGGAIVKGVNAVKDVVQAAKGTKVGKFITKATKKPNLGNVAKEGVEEGTKSFASKAVESFKKGEIRSGIENVKSTKGYNTLSTVKGQLDQADATGEMYAGDMRNRSSQHFSSMANIGNTNTSATDEDLSSVLTYKVAPFKMKSPFKIKNKKKYYK